MSNTNALHAAVTFHSEAYAQQVFGDLFGLSTVKTFDIGPDLSRALFDLDRSARIIQYDAGDSIFEVFIDPEAVPVDPTFDHLCIAVPDREAFLALAADRGMEVRRFVAGSKEVVFIRDEEGHLYEVKPRD